jgi:hypothetical protein
MKKAIVHQIDDEWYVLLEDFEIQFGEWKTTIPKGFLTDGPSIPKCFRWFISKPDILEPSIWHDYARDWNISKTAIDFIFFALCKTHLHYDETKFMSRFKAWCILVAVRIGIHCKWKRNYPSDKVIVKAYRALKEYETI